MGDPTEPAKGEEPHNIHSDEEGQPESDNEDAEAEVIQPAAVARATDVSQHLQDQNPGTCRAIPDVSSNADTVQSILSSIANPNAAIVIPLDANTGGGDGEIDAARMERFYTGALSAITKVSSFVLNTVKQRINILWN